ncbi:uncharacterized protein LOC133911434 [Phragmites australis]|uniref:uncharacterized protein LOC133911434 n=1 Tax=Phragmites australis TaxID=29695 RepID=UPI002D7A240A|nr:uncharacterized protein LOC133911434 [Phragmites australis]
MPCPIQDWVSVTNLDPKFLNDLFSEKLECVSDRVYVVEDGLLISQASAMTATKLWCKKEPDVVMDMDLTMNKQEAVALVRAVVTSKTALRNVFKSWMEEACKVS